MMSPSQEEPIVETQVGSTRLTLLGTAHVSRASAEKVAELLGEHGLEVDAVAVELCQSRVDSLTDPDALARLDLFAVIRQKRVYMVAASLALGAYQQRLADQFGIEPGAEQRMALRLAEARRLPVLLIDREVGTTLRRAAHNLGFFQRLNLFTGLLAGLLTREKVTEEEVEQLKQGDILETAFAEFAQDRAELFTPLISERDRYMAARLRQEAEAHGYRHILAVVGAGHLKGIAAQLAEQSAERTAGPTASDHAAPQEILGALDQVPQPSRFWRVFPWALVTLILGVFVYGFTRSPELGWNMVGDWVLINGGLSALGAALAGAHPLTVVGAFCAAPLTSLNPTIGAGMVAGAIELSLRRPFVGDFSRLRESVTSLRGWWQNRVSRILLVFIFSTLGSAVGTYLAGFRIVDRLLA
jgi:pheromone shutdown-related protein TraB